MEGELRRAQDMARSASAAAASTATIKDQALSALMASRKQVAAMEQKEQDFFHQQMEDEVEKAKRQRGKEWGSRKQQ